MFNFFKKKLAPSEELAKKYKERKRMVISEEEKKFFQSVFSALPNKYAYLVTQSKADILVTKAINLFDPYGFDLAIEESNEKKLLIMNCHLV